MSRFVKLNGDHWINRDLIAAVEIELKGGQWRVLYWHAFAIGDDQCYAVTKHDTSESCRDEVQRFLEHHNDDAN